MKVGDEFRTNQLSLTPGGSLVSVTYRSGGVKEYDKVKFPRAYVGRITDRESIVEIRVNGNLVWDKNNSKKFWESKD
jgi:hypothetical protein